jgi:proteasome lid subunit RPN8/RPN11
VHGGDRATYPGGVLAIRADLVDEIIAHARRDHPNEACGVIVGPEGGGRPERVIPMVNAAALPGYPGFHHPETDTVRFGDTFYTWESKADLLLNRELDARGEEMVVIYHSHTKPGSEAYPSVIDTEIAQGFPEAHHVIVGMQDPTGPGRPDVRSYRTVGPALVEEDVRVVESYDVVESYMFAHTGADAIPPED